MNGNEKATIQEHLTFLSDTLTLTEVITYLISKKVLDFNDRQNIQAERTDHDKVNCFIVLLTKGKAGPDAFRWFIEALKASNQGWIADKLLNTLGLLQRGAANNLTANAAQSGGQQGGGSGNNYNSGVQIGAVHGGAPTTYVSHGNMYFGGADRR